MCIQRRSQTFKWRVVGSILSGGYLWSSGDTADYTRTIYLLYYYIITGNLRHATNTEELIIVGGKRVWQNREPGWVVFICFPLLIMLTVANFISTSKL